jgi:hypothetical protein
MALEEECGLEAGLEERGNRVGVGRRGVAA